MRVKTTCNRDCPDACGIVATVEDGRIRRIQGDPDHPVTRGFLCHRTNRFLERQYDARRLTTPLIRDGSGFAPLSWDNALNLVARTMLGIREESGPAAILNYRSGGSLGLMKHVTDYFFERFGPVTIKSGDICSGAGEAAQLADFGEEDSHDLHDLYNSRTIILWGKNPYVSNVHLLPVLREAISRGTRMILIDPVWHRTARLCETYLQPRAGGDIALALAVARLLFENGTADAGAAEYCDDLDRFREACFARGIDEWARIADVDVGEVQKLADAFTRGPVAILVGWGMQRRRSGSATVRMLDALGAISGNLGIPGGGVSFYYKRRGAFDLSFVRGLDAAPRSIPEPLLGPGILEATDPEIRMVWVSNGNPVAMLPESATVARALETRELTVVVDSFLTDTAQRAKLVLPTTTMLEDDDLVGAYGHHYLGELRPVVPPPAEVKTDYQIIGELARRVGLEGELNDPVENWKQRLLGRLDPLGVSLEAFRRGPVRNPLAPPVLFADRKFPTPTGRVNLIHEIDAEPARPTPERPLLLLAVSTPKAQSSQWAGNPPPGPAIVTVHPDAANGFGEGDTATLESELGSMTVRIALDAQQRRDIALMAKGGWYSEGRCANALIKAETTDAGGGAAYHDTPVRLLPTDPQ